MKTLLEIETLLEEKIPRSAVAQREGGGGRSLSYLPGHYVISRINKIFGPFGWASDVKALDLIHSGEIEKFGKKTFTVHYKALIRLVVQGPDGVATEHTDVGYGDGSDKENIGKAHELAMKEAITDGIKRCAKNLGGSMGLYLYDKDQTMVEDGRPSSVSEKPSAGKPVTADRPGQPTPNASTSSEGRKTNPPVTRPSAQGAHADRELVNKSINAHSKIVIAKSSDQTQAKEKLKGDMRAKYGTDEKERLTDDQATEFLAELKARAGA